MPNGRPGMNGLLYVQWRLLELLATKGRSYSIAELATVLADCRGGEALAAHYFLP